MRFFEDTQPETGNQGDEISEMGTLLSHFAGIANLIPEALIAIDPQTAVIGWNSKAAAIYGWNEAEVLGLPIDKLLQTQYPTGAPTGLSNGLTDVEAWSGEVNQVRKDGAYLLISTSISSLKDKTGRLLGWIAANRPVKPVDPSVADARENEARFSAAYEASPASQLIAKPDGTYVDVNQSYCDLVGYTRAELIGSSAAKLGIIDPLVRQNLVSALESSGRSVDINIRTRDGAWRTALYSLKSITLNGLPHHLFSAIDITDRVRAETRLARMERLYAALSQVNQTIIKVKDPQLLYQSICDITVQAGRFTQAWIGVLEEETGVIRPVAANGFDVTRWSDPFFNINADTSSNLTILAMRSCRVEISNDIMNDERTRDLQAVHRKYNVSSAAAIPFTRQGKPTGVLTIISAEVNPFQSEEIQLLEEFGLDVSFALDSMETEKVKRQWADAFENCAQGIVMGLASNNRILTCNPAFARNLGRETSEIAGRHILDQYVPQDHDLVLEANARSDRTGSASFEAHMIRKDGSVFPVQMDLASVRDENGGILYRVVTQQDITERKRVEEKLIANERNLKLFVENAPASIALLDKEMRYLAVSRRFLTDYHLPDQDLIGLCHYDVFPEIDERIRASHARCLKGVSEKGEAEPFLRADGRTDWLHWETHPWYDEKGEVGGLIIFSEMITERKQAQDEILKRNQDLTVIKALNDAVNRGDEIDKIIEVFSRESHDVFNCKDVAIYLLSPDRRFIELNATSISPTLVAQIEKLIGQKLPKVRIPLRDTGYFQKILTSEEGLINSDPVSIQEWIAEFAETTFLPPIVRAMVRKLIPQIYKAIDIRSTLTIPLVLGGEPIGILDLSSTDLFTDQDLKRMRRISFQVTAVILRKRAENQVKTQLSRMRSLNKIDRAISSSLDMHLSLDVLLGEVLTQLDVDAAFVLLLDAPSQTLQYFAGKGFRSRSIRQARVRMADIMASGGDEAEHGALQMPRLSEARKHEISGDLRKDEGFQDSYSVPLVAKGQLKGALQVFNRSHLDDTPDWISYLETLAGQAAIAIDNAQLFEGVKRSNFELITAYEATIAGWSQAMDLRDRETEGHSQRVTELTVQLAEQFGLKQTDMVHIRRGALLHDIGKMGVPDQVLNKPGPLDDEEWAIMRQHPAFAYNLLTPIHYLRQSLDIPYCHHEKWDGTGYPRGLSGEQIPIAARLFSVVDVWDALLSDRPYRPRWSTAQARRYLVEQSGKHFDPQVVEAFLRMLDEGK